MKLQEQTMHGYEFLAFKDANISQVEGLDQLLSSFTKRISISYSRTSTVKTYCRALRDVSLFHGCLPQGLETDQILDYLHFLKEKGLSWAKIKLDAAGLKYFYRDMTGDESLASTQSSIDTSVSSPTLPTSPFRAYLSSGEERTKERVAKARPFFSLYQK